MIASSGYNFDLIIISGEPYVDHPSSGLGIIARVLEAQGYKVGVIGKPDLRDDQDLARLGKPRLFFGLTSGAIDSMVVNYTPLKRRRAEDPHAPYQSGLPDRALIVYSNKIRHLFPGIPIILGGMEASQRRFAHYDYWQNKVRRSLLLDSRADLLVYGPGELQIIEIARRLARGEDLAGIAGTCIVSSQLPPGFQEIPSYEAVAENPEQFCQAQTLFSNSQALAQGHDHRFVLQYPMPNYTTQDLDWIYSLPYSRIIPAHFKALDLALFSIVTHRGCLGNCSFCSLALHQGNHIISRSEESIIKEIEGLTRHPLFKGYIDDLGGPSANMYGMDCSRPCDRDCLTCPKLDRSHQRLISLLKEARKVPKVKKVFMRSGIRYDLAMESREYLRELCTHHISGGLKIAPEHVSSTVLRLMHKGGGEKLEEFRRIFSSLNRNLGQHLKYYFMVAHPGANTQAARELARAIHKIEQEGEYHPIEGVQIFTPTPMTRSTCMYHTGRDPQSGQSVYVPRTFQEKKEQKRMLLTSQALRLPRPRQKN